ncbi:MAG: cytochrome c biogenesis protein CcsA [Prolixibacteraceae bacterium]|nr:cytochrome c biogenesis protein CcsA [Prolixibacteraceae bacterium]
MLLCVLILAMSVATLLESRYGTVAARIMVYQSWWFSSLWVLLCLNLIFSIVNKKMYRAKHLPAFVLHIAFPVILAGAAITHFAGFEGIMHLREGQTSNTFLLSDNYFYASSDVGKIRKKIALSEATPRRIREKLTTRRGKLSIRSQAFMYNAYMTTMPDADGKPVIDIVYSIPDAKGMQNILIEKKGLSEQSGFSVGFEADAPSAICFFEKNGQLLMVVADTITQSEMGTAETETILPGDTVNAQPMRIYDWRECRFLIREFHPAATITAMQGVDGQTGLNAVLINLSDGIREKNITLFAPLDAAPDAIKVDWQGEDIFLAYGANTHVLPFSLTLNDFKLERYPGSESPSSFTSEVTLDDKNKNKKLNFSIFMNNTLAYGGYRFFQSSYDTDEKGSILSVNHDSWGTAVTYLGYFLLLVGIVVSLISPKSYFRSLAKQMKTASVKATVAVFLILSPSVSHADNANAGEKIPRIDKEVVRQFERLWVHSSDGRIKPVSTLAGEVVRKLSRKQTIAGIPASEVLLSIAAYPEIWENQPVIKISNKTLAEYMGAKNLYISASALFDEGGRYKIGDEVKSAYAKAPSLRSKIDKEFIYLDEKVNILSMVINGDMFSIFPTADVEAPWLTPKTEHADLPEADGQMLQNSFLLLKENILTQNVDKLLQIVADIETFQNRYGATFLPTKAKNKAEIFYNQVNIFERIYRPYLISGFLLLIILLVNLFRMKDISIMVRYIFYGFTGILFLAHTAGLALRWYIAGHAPWSNGFESMVYMSWAAMLAGFLFGRKYPMIVAIASMLAGLSLFMAYLNWMNPEITTLVPVLKSYWLAVHVAVITGSYGFLGLGAFIGILTMILMIIRNEKNGTKITLMIDQLTVVNEMAALTGLCCLTLGTFFGAVWANVSWGRYWGWDPKETWALITILVYTFITHLRLIKPLRGKFNFNMSMILGFSSVLITYFGVNYFMSGLHSYGSGLSDGIPPVAPFCFVVLVGIIIFASVKNSLYEKYMNRSSEQKHECGTDDA